MSILERMSVTTASIFLLMPFFACAAGIDDIANYKSPSTPVDSNRVEPYTIQDIINILPNSLNKNGVYENYYSQREKQNAWQTEKYETDPRAIAFDEEKFGKCKDFYIHNYMGHKVVGGVFDSTLRYLFPNDEGQKIEASHDIKKSLEEPSEWARNGSEYRSGGVCANWEKYKIQLKEILNTVIQAAPTILQAALQVEHHRVEIAREANAKSKARMLAEKRGSEERANKLKACQNTNAYKIYETSGSIEINQAIAKNAQLEMQRQKEGAEISGYVDKQVMYKMGNTIAEVNRLNKENFEIYKKLGGSARNIESVHSLPNPCSM